MSHAHSCKSNSNFALAQSLDEMEFERGIWSAGGYIKSLIRMLKKSANEDTKLNFGNNLKAY